MTQSDPTWLDDAFKEGGAIAFTNGGTPVPGAFAIVNMTGPISAVPHGDGSLDLDFDETQFLDQALDLVDRDWANSTGQNGNQLLGFRGSTAPHTLTLSPTPTAGTRVTVKDTDGGAATFPITVNGNGPTIDGAATHVISAAWGSVTLQANGLGSWSIIASMP